MQTYRTDIGILSFIPVPIIWKIKIPLRQKILVALLLCSGLFIIAAAIIRCVSSIQQIRSIDTAGVWAIRETFVTIIAINAPCIKPLFSSSPSNEARNGGFKLRNGGGDDAYEGRVSEASSQVQIVNEAVDGEMDTGIKVTTMVVVDTHDSRPQSKNDTRTYVVAAGAGWGNIDC
jgi:hypothetical protein